MNLRSHALTVYRLIAPLFDPLKLWRGFVGYPRYFLDLARYRALAEKENRSAVAYELFPCLHDRTSTTGFDAHYCYLAYWATRKLIEQPMDATSPLHVDVGSQVSWLMALAAMRPVISVDIRPFDSKIPTLEVRKGTVLDLPFEDSSVDSLSCLHVAEHIGLGRYGDPLDPKGTEKAIAELARVLSPRGRLLFALPVGRERVSFDAHRVYDPCNIVNIFLQSGLEMKTFSAVGDDRAYSENACLSDYSNSEYACGMFEFGRRICR